jgi:site-specific DNA recombinase
MKVALYGRYSSEGQREASIDDQFRNCEHYAAREGWQIVERYADKGISGTKDETGRDGYAAMLKAARGKQFDVLLVDDLSRLSRDSMKTEEARRLFVFLGVRLIGVSDGIDSAAKGSKALSGFKGLMNDIFLDDLREKTHRGLAGQALKGNNCGGRVYGYKPVPVEHPTEKDEYGRPKILAVRREIDEEQARWVRHVFQWYAEGRSPRDIAGKLNLKHVPAPGAAYRRKRPSRCYGTWSASVLHGDLQHATGMLSNPIYIGKAIWNRREWVMNPETKRRVPRLRPEAEWIITEQPELRIIPQALWEQVQRRRKAQAQSQQGHLGRGPKYLLSGLLKCDECDSNFVVSDYYRYCCGGHLNRRAPVCTNDRRVSRTLVEERCLAGLRDDLLTPDSIERIIKKTARLLAASNRERQPEVERLHRQLATVEGEITNILKAIKAGILTPSTKAELEQAEAERTRLIGTIKMRVSKADKVATLLPRAAERYRAVVNDLGCLSKKHVAQAREQIRELVGEIRLTPTADGYLEAVLTRRNEGVLKLAVGSKLNNLVAGEGFEPSTFGL